MLHDWLGQGGGIAVGMENLLFIAIGFFAAGFLKKRTSKFFVFLTYLLLVPLCSFFYTSGDMMGAILGVVSFGAITMMLMGAVIRFLIQFLLAHRPDE